MLSLLLLAGLVSAAVAVPPAWYNGPCGQSKYADAGEMALPASRLIVGGIESREHEFPWTVSLRRKLTNSHFCGGSVINQRWILTAAHCVVGETAASLQVAVGEHDRSANSDVRQMIDVIAVRTHPDYTPRTMENDVALLQLASDVAFSEDVQPVCGPEPADQYNYRKTVCSGWGSLQSGGSCCPQILRYVSMNITTNTFCDTAYNRDDITADMICASDNNGGDDRDSCQGDSGGPLAVKEADGTFTVVGIVSWGIGCASGYPGVYARVSFFNDWILGEIGAV